MTFKETRAQFRAKKVSAKELVQNSFKNINKHEELNVFISKFEEDAMDHAEHIDNNFNFFKDLPLGGIPIAHKDIFCTKGKKTTCASKMLESFVPPHTFSLSIGTNFIGYNAGSLFIY